MAALAPKVNALMHTTLTLTALLALGLVALVVTFRRQLMAAFRTGGGGGAAMVVVRKDGRV